MDIIIVEGTHDEVKVKEAIPDAFCVITNGSEISKSTIEYIKKLSETNNIIIFTDPDGPGERIRSIIAAAIPNASQAFLKKKLCISNNKRKVGIEHASKEDIIEALEGVYTPSKINYNINNNDLFRLGLSGLPDSAILRDKISDKLNIGRPNAKSFLKRINMIGLTIKELEELICQVK